LLIVIPALQITLKPVKSGRSMKGRLVGQVLLLLWVCHPVSSKTAECRQNSRPIPS